MSPQPTIQQRLAETIATEAAVRLTTIALRRYTREPSDRPASARNLALNALRIAIAELGAGEAAILAAEVIAAAAQAGRRQG